MPYRNNLIAGLQPDPVMTISEWADTHRILPKESSAEPGKYRTERTAYLREPMNHLAPSSPVQHVVVQKGTQLGWTTVAENLLFFVAAKTPGPCLVVFPTDDLARRFSKKRIAPSLRLMDSFKKKIRDPRSRDSGNTALLKEFPGGSWRFTSSNSGPALRSDSVRFLILDDRDGFELDAAGEGEPGELAKKRTDTFSSNKKIYENSTPTVRGISRIEKSFELSSKGYYYMPCPFCNELLKFEFGNLKFNKECPDDEIFMECPDCKDRIKEHYKPEMLTTGQWIHKHPDRKIKGYHLNSLYSPLGWVSWRQIVEEFLEAKKALDMKDPSKMKVWVNTRLANTWDDSGERPEWANLLGRCEPYQPETVPMGGLILAAGVDVQDDRLVVVVRAWGKGEESWLIYWGEIFGDPDTAVVWEQLDVLLEKAYPHESGTHLNILSAGIDSGGHKTQAVYNYCRLRFPRVIAVKGQSRAGKPVIGRPTNQDVTWMGSTIKNGVKLWPVGTDTAKALIYGRLNITSPGPGCYHFPIGTPEDYFQQLTAEKFVTRYVKGFPKPDWIKIPGRRNDYLDTEVYAYAAAVRSGLAMTNWDKLKQTISGGAGSPVAKNDNGHKTPARQRTKPRFARPSWLDR